jgi:hypothetical protein
LNVLEEAITQTVEHELIYFGSANLPVRTKDIQTPTPNST